MPEKTHKLAAIVFTDIVGYTRRMEEDEQLTMQLLQQQREIVFPLAESYGGEVIKEIGDGLLMMFDSAVQAVRFAIAVQTRLKDEELTIRAGIHIGDVIFKGGDVFGSAVNTAARIEPLASPNGICISEDVRSQLHNKSDIITISQGKKDLKGVSEPVEIFEIFIEGVSVKRSRSVGFIFKDLWRRNVIQILLGFIAAAWVVKLAVAAIVDQYMLSPHLIELSWILLMSLIPAVGILAYFHGKRSSGKWTKIELLGLPLNLVLSIVLLFIMFNGKDLGAATKAITVENEAGETVTRKILKSEFRKDIVLFFFDNQTGKPEYDWMQYGLTTILSYDLSQDTYMDVLNGLGCISKFIDAGLPGGLDAPMMLKREIAEYYHKEFFTLGEYSIEGENWKVVLEVYDTQKGSLIKTITLNHSDIFDLADLLSVEIKKAVGMPAKQIGEVEDLPVGEIFTNSMTAFENYTMSTLEALLHNNYEQAIEYGEKAVLDDAEFALAYLTLGEYYFNSNQAEKTEEAINFTMDKIYKLPERNQFYAKFFYYIVRQEADQANAILKMWADLYPYDITAHQTLAQRYLMMNDFANAISVYKYIVTLAPKEYEYIRTLGDIYEMKGNYDSSLYFYEVYAEQLPEDPLSYKNLGDTYQRTSQFEKAMENYNRALILEPGNSSTSIKIARIHMINGDFDKSEDLLLSSLKECPSANDSVIIVTGLEGLAKMEGKVNLSFDYHIQKFQLYKRIVHPLRYMVLQIFMIGKYVEVQRESEALTLLQNIEAELEPRLRNISAFGYLFYYADIKQPDKAAEYIDDALELMRSFGEENLIANVYYAEGRIAELNNNYELAVEKYKSFLELQPASSDAYRWIARSYFELGNEGEAKEYIENALVRNPNDPKTLYEAARIFYEDGDEDEALEYILKANEIWKEADVFYEPAKKAREFRMNMENV